MRITGLVLAFTLAQVSLAQPIIPPDAAGRFNQSVADGLNAVTIFTTQNSVSSGTFKTQRTDIPDGDFSVLRVPLKFTFGESGDELRPFVEASIAQFLAKDSINPLTPGAVGDFSRLSTLSGEVGGGVHWAATERLQLTGAFGLAYSHAKRRYDFNSPQSQQLLQPFDREVFNTSLELFTYSPRAKIKYTVPVGSSKVIATSRYAHLWNESTSSKSSIIDFSTDTGLWQNVVEVQAPLDVSVADMPLGVRPYVGRSELSGSARDGLGLNHFYEFGIDLSVDTTEHVEALGLLHVGIAYTSGDDFQGWRLGLGGAF